MGPYPDRLSKRWFSICWLSSFDVPANVKCFHSHHLIKFFNNLVNKNYFERVWFKNHKSSIIFQGSGKTRTSSFSLAFQGHPFHYTPFNLCKVEPHCFYCTEQCIHYLLELVLSLNDLAVSVPESCYLRYSLTDYSLFTCDPIRVAEQTRSQIKP